MAYPDTHPTYPLEQAYPLTVLYTAGLAGRLALLPKLFTRIRQERATVTGPALLVDLGRSCASGTWICEATAGRGMLVAMDAMGYDAFHIGPQDSLYTEPALVQQMREVILTPLAAGPWLATVHRGDLTIQIANAPQLARLHPIGVDLLIGLRLDAAAQIDASWRDGQRLVILNGGEAAVAPGSLLLGRLDIVLLPEAPYIEILSQNTLTLTDDDLNELLPDPLIVGVIEFVESEARYAARKRGQG